MKIDTSSFCAKYKIDDNGKYGHYKTGVCEVCGKETTQVDATMLWDGIPVYLCSDECHDKYWN